MIKIPGLTEQEVFEVIELVIEVHKNKSFSIYDSDDIKQQAWTIVLDKLPDFDYKKGKANDIKKSLEHWLNAILSNRLANFYRDKQLVMKYSSAKTTSLENKHFLIEDNQQLNENLLNDEKILSAIKHLDFYYIDILDSLLSGEKINSYYKIKLINKIKDILNVNKSKSKRK